MDFFEKKVKLFTLYLAMGCNILSGVVVCLGALVFHFSPVRLALTLVVSLILVNGAIVWGVHSATAPG